MPKADLFWQHAEEAMLWARQSKTEREKRAFLDLARTWTQAAMNIEATLAQRIHPAEPLLRADQGSSPKPGPV
jgi:hypothetical protein